MNPSAAGLLVPGLGRLSLVSPKQAAVAKGVTDFGIVNFTRCARFWAPETASKGGWSFPQPGPMWET